MIPCGVCPACKAGNTDACHDPIFGQYERGRSVEEVVRNSQPLKGFSSTSASKLWGTLDTGNKKIEKCAHSHKPLKVNDQITLYGGAAREPIHKDCDIYVSLDFGTDQQTEKAYPWNGGPQFIYYPITDMNAPKDASEFKKMVGWLKEQALAGKKIHVGCIGGHGRTGMLLAALVKEIAGIEDAIKFVREGYCQKAVETTVQVDFLNKYFGITKRGGHKAAWSGKGGGYKEFGSPYHSPSDFGKRSKGGKHGPVTTTYPVKPAVLKGNVWGITN